uniref:Putative secreted protein n=1 Tax=Anopheles triannulatus TaxID=58253 RepID=A0A2M4B7G4_9DIPT
MYTVRYILSVSVCVWAHCCGSLTRESYALRGVARSFRFFYVLSVFCQFMIQRAPIKTFRNHNVNSRISYHGKRMKHTPWQKLLKA